MNDFVIEFLDFMDRGGPVLWPILGLTITLAWLVGERFWHFRFDFPKHLAAALDAWQQRPERASWYARLRRRQLLSELDCQMALNLKVIRTLIALLPMFGLLGTVTGMIAVFDVMANLGSGNPRAMADGVSSATIPTMSGMVIALLALPFATRLDHVYKRNMHDVMELIVEE